jgi:hypothetical protein
VCIPHTWKPWEEDSIPFKKKLNSHRAKCARHSSLYHILLFHKIHVFLHFVGSVCFSKGEWFSHFKMLSDRKISFHMLTHFSQENNVLEPLAINIYDFLPRDIVLLPVTWMEQFCTRWCSSHWKTLRGRQHSFQKVTEISQGNKVQDTPASNTLYFSIG